MLEAKFGDGLQFEPLERKFLVYPIIIIKSIHSRENKEKKHKN